MPFSVKVITPFRTVARRDDAEFVFANGAAGDIGILSGHAPFLAHLIIGEVRIESPAGAQRFAVSAGFLDARPDSVTVMAETAERKKDIDIERAREARNRAEKRLAAGTDDLDVARAEAALARAINRIHVAERGQ